MATLDTLKQALRQVNPSSARQPLSDTQYEAGFDILMQGSCWTTYQEFVYPQLSRLLDPLFNSRTHISVLEIGPGPESVLGHLSIDLRQKIRSYVAFEPNSLFATKLGTWLCTPKTKKHRPLPNLENALNIFPVPFDLDSYVGKDTGPGDAIEKFNVVLFCHSMYGMQPKRSFVERALKMLVEQAEGGMVVVFHRDVTMDLDGLVCHRTASFPTGLVRVANNDKTIDCFASFITGSAVQEDDAVLVKWRKVCRDLGRREEADSQEHLLFSSPDIMAAFTRHSTALPELMAKVPVVINKTVKNRKARLSCPATIMRPTEIQHVQNCVQWALNHDVGLTVIGGGHSGHCLWPNVVAVDMAAFDRLHVLTQGEDVEEPRSSSGCLVIAEAGCTTGDIVRKTMAAGLTVPLGARPSVGAGLWLQGGIGHLARLHGLTCDAVVGAVIVSVDSGQVLCVGHVPRQHQPAGAVRPENEKDLLWAMKGAGTNFGIVVSVTFMAYAAPTFTTRDWIIPMRDSLEVRRRLREFDQSVASNLPRNCSADAYLYWDAGQLYLGVTLFESTTTGLTSSTSAPILTLLTQVLGSEANCRLLDSVGLFEAEMYMTEMHGGHVGGKTSSFKRCLFLKGIGRDTVANALLRAIETRPSPLCYLHLLQGGGAVGDVAKDATAFGNRDWDFACVVTGVWPREQDRSEDARAAEQWVYDVARDLLPLSSGTYGADLGPDPRDAALASKAFGPNQPRLIHLKHASDPYSVLSYTCPLPKAPMVQKLILLVTGDSGAGKDYCADAWASLLIRCAGNSLTVRVVSISSAMKEEYAEESGADLGGLLYDRRYKEQHRSALIRFFQQKVQENPRLPEEHFVNVVYNAADVDVLLITGMRDEAPVASLSHLVADRKMLDVRVEASRETLRARGGWRNGNDVVDDEDNNNSDAEGLNSGAVHYRPSFIFKNDTAGDEMAKTFAEQYLLPFLHEDLHRLADMVHTSPDFPRPGIEFRHVLGISEQPGGLALCSSLLHTHFTGNWLEVDAVVCCEAGGFVFASALASRADVPLALIREAGKLPSPTASVIKPPSHISSSALNESRGKKIEMGRDVVPRGGTVVVVDDVLATGETLCAVIQLLCEVGICADHISIMTVAELPVHRGRALLRQRGFGKVNVQSLLVFGGA
ncbi:phosphoribosyl transferase domain protein [Colletotrichum truncatum]|uniref:Phosphoribosyl transferase domain protein n=1 Tax=Colletotrichum truncatum TaxID=5467 RepID=A0ACC3YCP3_COLTU